MIPAPARAIATMPSIQAASSARNTGPVTWPSAAISMPPGVLSKAAGIASISVSVPNVSHGSGKTVCRQRMIPVLPELEPPLSTITRVSIAPPYKQGPTPVPG
jgi:hypothetical protein